MQITVAFLSQVVVHFLVFVHLIILLIAVHAATIYETDKISDLHFKKY